jgi:hypothetical protein
MCGHTEVRKRRRCASRQHTHPGTCLLTFLPAARRRRSVHPSTPVLSRALSSFVHHPPCSAGGTARACGRATPWRVRSAGAGSMQPSAACEMCSVQTAQRSRVGAHLGCAVPAAPPSALGRRVALSAARCRRTDSRAGREVLTQRARNAVRARRFVCDSAGPPLGPPRRMSLPTGGDAVNEPHVASREGARRRGCVSVRDVACGPVRKRKRARGLSCAQP